MGSDRSLTLSRRSSAAALLAAAALAAGCGSTGGASTTRGAHATATPTTGSHPLDARTITLANFVCRSVRTGAPAALSPAATRAQLVARAPAAGAAALRTAVSLQRLGPHTGHRAALAPLVAGYRRLATLYAGVGSPGSRSSGTASSVTSIIAAEQQVALAARSLGLGSCAPAPAAP